MQNVQSAKSAKKVILHQLLANYSQIDFRQKRKNLETIVVSRFFMVDANGLEPLTPCTIA